MAKDKIKVNGLIIRLSKTEDSHYISLTDLAKKRSERPAKTIENWMHSRSTLGFLKAWEALNNPNFKVLQEQDFKGWVQIEKEYMQNSFSMYPSKWVEYTNSIGFKVKRGKYGGTWAHEDIALEFASWLSPEFKLYVITEFKRLKTEEHLRIGDPFNIKRFLTSGNYSLMVSAVLSQIDERLLTHPQPYKKRLPFAAEADMINEIVFGQTAKEWRKLNPEKPVNRNQRDYASVLDLQILANLESLDSMLLQWGCDKDERKNFLQEMYDFQYPVLKRSKTIQKLQELSDNLEKLS